MMDRLLHIARPAGTAHEHVAPTADPEPATDEVAQLRAEVVVLRAEVAQLRGQRDDPPASYRGARALVPPQPPLEDSQPIASPEQIAATQWTNWRNRYSVVARELGPNSVGPEPPAPHNPELAQRYGCGREFESWQRQHAAVIQRHAAQAEANRIADAIC